MEVIVDKENFSAHGVIFGDGHPEIKKTIIFKNKKKVKKSSELYRNKILFTIDKVVDIAKKRLILTKNMINSKTPEMIHSVLIRIATPVYLYGRNENTTEITEVFNVCKPDTICAEISLSVIDEFGEAFELDGIKDKYTLLIPLTYSFYKDFLKNIYLSDYDQTEIDKTTKKPVVYLYKTSDYFKSDTYMIADNYFEKRRTLIKENCNAVVDAVFNRSINHKVNIITELMVKTDSNQ